MKWEWCSPSNRANREATAGSTILAMGISSGWCKIFKKRKIKYLGWHIWFFGWHLALLFMFPTLISIVDVLFFLTYLNINGWCCFSLRILTSMVDVFFLKYPYINGWCVVFLKYLNINGWCVVFLKYFHINGWCVVFLKYPNINGWCVVP